ncbi:MAG TPA: hypothetical protein VG015_00045 [Candidatus Dormibacteraeota bacterium]|jgi:hypothetical protein|nr:hypothetical protein [Candidatus Dormibacteraeota bacterium]
MSCARVANWAGPALSTVVFLLATVIKPVIVRSVGRTAAAVAFVLILTAVPAGFPFDSSHAAMPTTSVDTSTTATPTTSSASASPDSAVPGQDLLSGFTPPDSAGIFAAESGGDLIRVGRWMSPVEHDAMVGSGMVQEGAGGVSSVANPANVAAYERQAAAGSRYVEFNVPSSSVRQGGAPGWGIIDGPNSNMARFAAQAGGPVPQFPAATAIEWVASRLGI